MPNLYLNISKSPILLRHADRKKVFGISLKLEVRWVSLFCPPKLAIRTLGHAGEGDEDEVFEGAGAGLGWALLSTALAPGLRSGPPGSEARLPGDQLEPPSPRKALREGQGAAANSELFALHWLPRAQAPFLVNILDGRTEHNSPFPLRGVDRQSQEHCWWGWASKAHGRPIPPIPRGLPRR